ncbi:class II aldolase/adducin family protein [Streptomyces sp. NPDC048665]|uniref:class II aldolase/adducin family protein n=1 Tax=Streptomyces sp. NPDC048665 TaxID=3155490 RepID=UPI00343424A4
MKPVYIRDDAELQRAHLSLVGRSLHRSGWLPGTFGSVSLRSGEAVMITAGGLNKGVMDPADTVLVDPFEGLPLSGETEWPPAETPIHLAVHRRLPDCAAVVHAHAPYSTALATLAAGDGHIGRVVFRDLEMAKGLGSPDPRLVALPVVANRPDVSRVADDVTLALDASAADVPPALLVERSGILAWGRDTDEARDRLECIEELSHFLLLTGTGTAGAVTVHAR